MKTLFLIDVEGAEVEILKSLKRNLSYDFIIEVDDNTVDKVIEILGEPLKCLEKFEGGYNYLWSG